MFEGGSSLQATRGTLPRALIVAVIAASVIPGLLHLAGFDFGSPVQVPDAHALEQPGAALPALHRALHGSIVHALLEWSAVAVASFTVILAFAHDRGEGDRATLVIALALFTSGCVDAFHALAATHLVHGAADSTNFIPFTWAISRVFHVLILLVGTLVLPRLHSRGGVLAVGAVFGLVAYAVVTVCSTSEVLPRTMYPDALITRPWDFVPLVLFLIAGVFVFPRLHREHPSAFIMTLWLSVLPDIVTEAHMAFGSSQLFDSHFQIAHFTKVVAYAVPLSGLVLDYARAYGRLEQVAGELDSRAKQLEQLNEELGQTNTELGQANADLEQFAYVASHDLRAPLRAIDNLATWLSEDLEDTLEGENLEHLQLMRARVARMDGLLNALLSYSRIGRTQVEVSEFELAELIEDIEAMYMDESSIELVVDTQVSTLSTSRVALQQVLANLISNAVKHRDEHSSRVELRCIERGDWLEFRVADDGPGIAPEYHERVFEMFQTLRPRDEVEGSGMGLALVKRQVATSGGELQLESGEGRGTAFTFTWPRVWPTQKN